MERKKFLKYCIDSLSEAGVDKSQCRLKYTKKDELNVDTGEISLFRTTFDTDLEITAIHKNRKGRISINKLDKDSIDKAIVDLIELSKTSEIDEAYDIAPKQETKVFSSGDEKPDLDKMYSLLDGFLVKVKDMYPQIKLEQVIFDFVKTEEYLMNSNGVDFQSNKGIYKLTPMFTSKDDENTTSFNYTQVSLSELKKDLLECGSIDYLLKESVEQLKSKPLEGKFVGDIIITPDCLNDFIYFLNRINLSGNTLISGTSTFKDKINKKVASSKFTLHSNPVSEEICNGYFVTDDGFEAENLTIIKDGVLKSFLLSQYAANKTKLERSKNTGNAYIVESGDKTLDELIKDIDRGIVISRFSGGNPSPNSDFSGVAKNSFYIENGEIKYPITETMISGNLNELLLNINDISKERVNFGSSLLPWISTSGITISGK